MGELTVPDRLKSNMILEHVEEEWEQHENSHTSPETQNSTHGDI